LEDIRRSFEHEAPADTRDDDMSTAISTLPNGCSKLELQDVKELKDVKDLQDLQEINKINDIHMKDAKELEIDSEFDSVHNDSILGQSGKLKVITDKSECVHVEP